MAPLEPTDLTQNEDNNMSAVAEAERKKIFAKNNYNDKKFYSSVSPDARATGDEKGRGTGGDLDVYNELAGNSLDTEERKKEIVINKYNSKRTYPDF